MIGRFGVALALGTGLLAGTAWGQQAPPPRSGTIRVAGTATVELEPDLAVVQFGVVTRGATAAEAGAANAELVRRVLDALGDVGVREDDLATSGYRVQAEWDRDRGARDLASYIAENSVQATVRDLERVGAVIDAATAAGANDVTGLRFDSERTEDARRQALADAVRAARADAEVIAAAAGGRLGTLLQISTGGMSAPGPEVFLRAERAMATTPVLPGDLGVTATVTAVWALEFRP